MMADFPREAPSSSMKKAIVPKTLRIHSSHLVGSLTKGQTLSHGIDHKLQHLRNISEPLRFPTGEVTGSKRKSRQRETTSSQRPNVTSSRERKVQRSRISGNRQPISRRGFEEDIFEARKIESDEGGAVRVVLQELNRVEGYTPLQQNDPRSVVMVSLVARVFAPVSFENCEILVLLQEIQGSYRLYFTGGEKVPFSGCCKSFVFGEFTREKGLQLICASKYCLTRVLYTVAMDYQKFFEMCKNLQIAFDEKENAASVQDPDSSKLISKFIRMGLHRKTNLSHLYGHVQDEASKFYDPSLQNESSPLPTIESVPQRTGHYYLPFLGGKRGRRHQKLPAMDSMHGNISMQVAPVYPYAPTDEPEHRGDLSKENVGAYLRMHKEVADNIWRHGKVFRVGDAAPPGYEDGADSTPYRSQNRGRPGRGHEGLFGDDLNMTTPELMHEFGNLPGGEDLGFEQADLSLDDGLNERDMEGFDGRDVGDEEEKHKDFTLAPQM